MNVPTRGEKATRKDIDGGIGHHLLENHSNGCISKLEKLFQGIGKLVTVPADGNCGYRALLDLLKRHGDIANYLNVSYLKDDLRKYIHTNQDCVEHCLGKTTTEKMITSLQEQNRHGSNKSWFKSDLFPIISKKYNKRIVYYCISAKYDCNNGIKVSVFEGMKNAHVKDLMGKEFEWYDKQCLPRKEDLCFVLSSDTNHFYYIV